ncbi:MAG: DUF2189 domain-containing protein [Alphaproteobacteria bacterium]|nr:DUF2189 domain-containing protein [Alphaproteobacteria bacterium]
MIRPVTGALLDDLPATEVRRVTVDDTARWLALGWGDMRRSPVLSLGFGAVFAAVGHLLTAGLAQAGMGSLVLPLGAGFMLLAPFLAVAFYEISRRHELGEKPDLAGVAMAWRRNPAGLGNMALVLILALFAWVQLALLLFMLFFAANPPPFEGFILDILSTPRGLSFLMVGTALGGALASVVFAISAVSLPMLLDRPVPAGVAVKASLAAVFANWRVMIGWALAIALITFAGMALFFVGLIVALPLVGHATWHAYRTVVV